MALGVRVERFEGLLAEVVSRAGPAEAPIGPLARERVLARLAGARPGLANALARLVAELETQRVTPARLRGALRAWGSADRGSRRRAVQAHGSHPLTSRAATGGRAAARLGDRRRSRREVNRRVERRAATLERLCGVYEGYHEALATMRRADRELRVTAGA